MNLFRTKTFFKVLFFVLVLALMMAPELPDDFLKFINFLGLNDKGEHVIAFFLLSLFLNRASSTGLHRLRNVLALFSFGITIEFIQLFIPERGTSLYDALANLAGILIFQLLFSIYLFVKQRKINSLK